MLEGMPPTHPITSRRHAVALARQGVTYPTIAELLHVPRGTIGYWVHEARKTDPAARRPPVCPRCDEVRLVTEPYAYLLGLYLGDGHITHKSRQHTLSIYCCDAWPGLIDAAEEAMRRVMPLAGTGRRQRKGCTEVKSYSMHWPCLFPQHGPGKKSDREILLAGWQRGIVEEHPGSFIRGLIHSDGCRTTNSVVRSIDGRPKRYEYPRYFFSNKSAHIIELFCGALDLLEVAWRRPKADTVSVARREAVGILDRHVGPKY